MSGDVRELAEVLVRTLEAVRVYETVGSAEACRLCRVNKLHAHTPGCDGGKIIYARDRAKQLLAAMEAPKRLRNESTPRAREIWQNVDRAAEGLPDSVQQRLDAAECGPVTEAELDAARTEIDPDDLPRRVQRKGASEDDAQLDSPKWLQRRLALSKSEREAVVTKVRRLMVRYPLAEARRDILTAESCVEPREDDCENCHRCLEGVTTPEGFPVTSTRMLVCPTCGNKRCPKASDHHLACTGSNASGQPGSIFTAAPEPTEDP